MGKNFDINNDYLQTTMNITELEGLGFQYNNALLNYQQAHKKLSSALQTNSNNSEDIQAVNNALNNVEYWNYYLTLINQNIISVLQDENPIYQSEIQERKIKNTELLNNMQLIIKEKDKVNQMIREYESENSKRSDTSIVTTEEYTKYIMYIIVTVIVIIIFTKIVFMSGSGQRGGAISSGKGKTNDILFLFALLFLVLSIGFFVNGK